MAIMACTLAGPSCPPSPKTPMNIPKLAGSQRPKKYRRSVTTRAPRKRTFIANMVKHAAEALSSQNFVEEEKVLACHREEGLGLACPPGAAKKAVFMAPELSSGNGNNNNDHGANTSFFSGGGGGSRDGGVAGRALFFMVGLAFAFNLALSNPGRSFARGNVEKKTSTASDTKSEKLVFGRVQLTPGEMRILRSEQDQYRVREYYRVQ